MKLRDWDGVRVRVTGKCNDFYHRFQRLAWIKRITTLGTIGHNRRANWV
jgi:hypothetical protein